MKIIFGMRFVVLRRASWRARRRSWLTRRFTMRCRATRTSISARSACSGPSPPVASRRKTSATCSASALNVASDHCRTLTACRKKQSSHRGWSNSTPFLKASVRTIRVDRAVGVRDLSNSNNRRCRIKVFCTANNRCQRSSSTISSSRSSEWKSLNISSCSTPYKYVTQSPSKLALLFAIFST